MAKKEVCHDNTQIKEELKSIPKYSSLSSEAKKVLYDTINNCPSLGKYKLPVEDIFYIVRNANELSKAQVEYHLTIYRSDKSKKFPNSVSSIEKYKRACTAVVVALEAFTDDGGILCGTKAAIKKVLPPKPMTDDQYAAIQSMIDTRATIDDFTAFFKSIS